MTFKKIYGWLHLWLGLAVGLIFTIAAITGALMIFEEDLDEMLYPDLYFCEAPAKSQHLLPIDYLFTIAQQHADKERVNQLIIFEKEGYRNFLFQTDGERLDRYLIAINPYTGKLQAKLAGRQHLFTVAEELHRKLFLGTVGKTITGICCLSYLMILVTGLLIWWPKNRRMLKQRLKIKWDAKAKRLNWDIHAVGGFYTLPILFVVTLTGLTWSYKWFNDGIFYLFDGKGPEKQATLLHLTAETRPQYLIHEIYKKTEKLLPYAGELSIRLPGKKEDVISVTKEQYHAAVPNVADRLFFNAFTGELVQKALYNTQSTGMKVRRLIFPIHTGSIGGWFTKILYAISILFGASLPFTGLFIWLGRKKKKKSFDAKADLKETLTGRELPKLKVAKQQIGD